MAWWISLVVMVFPSLVVSARILWSGFVVWFLLLVVSRVGFCIGGIVLVLVFLQAMCSRIFGICG